MKVKREITIRVEAADGQVLYWDPFSFWGRCINLIGRSGAGKSFLTKDLCKNVLDAGGDVFVFDWHGAFNLFCDYVGGYRVKLSRRIELYMYPFSTVPMGDGELTRDALNVVAGVLASVLGGCEFAEICQVVNLVWKNKGRKATITDVIDILQKESTCCVEELIEAFSPCGSGKPQDIFNRSFNVIDIAQLDEFGLVTSQQAIVIRGIISQIVNKVLSRDRHTPFVIVLEEHLQSLLASKYFVESVHKVLRRCDGILVSMGQGFDCFQGNAASKCLLDHSGATCVFAQTEDWSAEQLSDIPAFNHCIGLLQTVSCNSEMVMVGNDWAFKGKPVTDAFLKILYSSESAVAQKVEKFLFKLSEILRKQGKLEEAEKWLSVAEYSKEFKNND